MVELDFSAHGGGFAGRLLGVITRFGARWHHESLVRKVQRLGGDVSKLVVVTRDGRNYDVVSVPREDSDVWRVRCLPDIPHMTIRSSQIDRLVDSRDAYADGLLAR